MSVNPLTEAELDTLDLNALITRMDDILAAPYWQRRGREIMNLTVRELMSTKRTQSFPSTFQRKVAYKTFGLLLQLLYTDLSISAQFFRPPESDHADAKQLHWAARQQWHAVSSRIAFEYFMQLCYMLGTGKDFGSPESAFKKFRKWLKHDRNPYAYFAITVARAASFDRATRTPEVHAATKFARRILLLTADKPDNDLFSLYSMMLNQWQFVIDLADDRLPNGWVASGEVSGDKEWYELWKSGDQAAIHREIDRLFDNSVNAQPHAC